MIEYDKANITSSYPSLTEYEVATILDKSYLALIGQKFTGNNYRRVAFEMDSKSLFDLEGLVVTQKITDGNNSQNLIQEPTIGSNICSVALPEEVLYLINTFVEDGISNELTGNQISVDYTPVKMVPHDIATKFLYTKYNMPWIKIPVCYIENGTLYIIYDPYAWKNYEWDENKNVVITYIKTPASFIGDNNKISSTTEFELSDQMAEELISLAVTFALENVESQRLNSKINMRGLES